MNLLMPYGQTGRRQETPGHLVVGTVAVVVVVAGRGGEVAVVVRR